MSKKRIVISALVLVAILALVYLQVNTWKKFDWQTFKQQTEGIKLFYIGLGVVIIYSDYYLRALRWKILLRPVCQTTSRRLLGPTVVGFTAMALLGRPGEFIRPFLIAKRERLSMASQLAVWVVERIFDMGAFALIMAINIVASPSLRDLPGFTEGATKTIGNRQFTAFAIFQFSGLALLVGVVVAAVLAFLARRNPHRVAKGFQRIFSMISRRAGDAVYHRVLKFGEGLNTIHDAKSFFQISIISILLWATIGATYVSVTHAYSASPEMRGMTVSSAFLLTGASVAGGILQLPVVGGGSQLATIGTLIAVFNLPKELAISCGIMLWLVTFMSIVPVGLIVAHFERVSLIKVEKESLAEEEKAMGQGESPDST